MTRFRWIYIIAALLLNGPAWAVPVTGKPVPSLVAFDRQMQNLMVRYKIPGGSLAVVRKGRLVFVK